MAGRGRGRGRGLISFDVESLGFGRGEALPTACGEPPPLYPSLQFKPVPLVKDEEQDYLLALKQEFRTAMKDSPYYIKPIEKKRDIERYSDKYQLTNSENNEWKTDWKRFPLELKIRAKRKVTVKTVKPNPGRGKLKIKEEDISKTLEALEQKEKTEESTVDDVEEGEANEEDEEGEVVEEEELDEEELEDDTDYNQTYFDNGEQYGQDEEDDLDDGPTY